MKRIIKIFLFIIVLSSFIMPNVYAKELSITNIDDIIATKSSNSNVIKGSLIST